MSKVIYLNEHYNIQDVDVDQSDNDIFTVHFREKSFVIGYAATWDDNRLNLSDHEFYQNLSFMEKLLIENSQIAQVLAVKEQIPLAYFRPADTILRMDADGNPVTEQPQEPEPFDFGIYNPATDEVTDHYFLTMNRLPFQLKPHVGFSDLGSNVYRPLNPNHELGLITPSHQNGDVTLPQLTDTFIFTWNGAINNQLNEVDIEFVHVATNTTKVLNLAQFFGVEAIDYSQLQYPTFGLDRNLGYTFQQQNISTDPDMKIVFEIYKDGQLVQVPQEFDIENLDINHFYYVKQNGNTLKWYKNGSTGQYGNGQLRVTHIDSGLTFDFTIEWDD